VKQNRFEAVSLQTESSLNDNMENVLRKRSAKNPEKAVAPAVFCEGQSRSAPPNILNVRGNKYEQFQVHQILLIISDDGF
jgi:hypothetical protein